MEELNILEGRSGCVWPEVLRQTAESRRQGRRVVLYVPEQRTLQTERDLISGLQLKGLLDIEVISPKKLRMLVKEQAGSSIRRILDESGQVMAVHRAMTETAKDLIFYRNMTELPGAVERIREALSELKESDITPEETEHYAAKASTGALRAKLTDLTRIRKTYEVLVAEHFDDEKTAWTDTVSRLGDTGILRGADLLVYGFDTIRPDLRELLCRAAETAEAIYVFLTAGERHAPDGRIFREQHRSVDQLREAAEASGRKLRIQRTKEPRENCEPMLLWMDRYLFAETEETYPETAGDGISLYAAADPEDEAENIAGCLLDWHAKGIPWEKMAVSLPKESELEKVLRSRLRLNGIPYYSTEKIPAVSHGVCRMLIAALECISEGYTTEYVNDIAESGFCILSGEEALLLRRYATAHGIEGIRWRRPFERGEDAAQAEEIRKKLLGPTERFREALKKARSAAESVEAVVHLLEDVDVWNRLKEREEQLLRDGMYGEAVANRQVWKMLMEMLDQLWTLLGSRRASIRDLKNMLESALARGTVSTLPETEAGVVLGEVGHMLPGDTEALVVSGVREGVMSVQEAGWLSDRERNDLYSGTGREIGITRERKGWIRRFDFYRTMTLPGRYLMVSWSLRDGKGSPQQEDGMIGRLRTIFPGIRESGSVRGTEGEYRPTTPLKALESMGMLFRAIRNGREEPAAKNAVIALLHSGIYGRTVRRMIAEELQEREKPVISPETARELFPSGSTSISRLERYAACPYQHFIDYGLRPVRQETYEFDDAEAGSFFHAALDRFMKTAGQEAGWPDWTDEKVDGMMDDICAELTKDWEGGPLREDALGIWQGEEYLRRVHHAARVLTRFAANSDFRTIATEQSFGKTGELPPLTLTLRDGSQVELQGTIDRIDTYENGEGLWLRIVDNKSSVKKPDPARMETGEQLQLMIYLKAAGNAYPGAQPAGALFFPVQDAEISAEDETPETLETERLKKARMKGLVNAREDVVRAMDRDLRPYSMDEVFNKDGSVRKSAAWAVEENVLQGLMEAAEAKAAEICADIRDGRIEPVPRGSGEEDSPCRYCDYRTVCRKQKDSMRPRETEISYRDLAGKNTLRGKEK